MDSFKKSHPKSFVVKAGLDSSYLAECMSARDAHANGVVLQVYPLEGRYALIELVKPEDYQPVIKVPMGTTETSVRIAESLGFRVIYDVPCVQQ